MSLRQAAFLILDEVQVFDQQRALAWPVAEQRLDGGDLLLSEHPAARERRRLAASGARMDRATASPSHRVALGNVIHAREPAAAGAVSLARRPWLVSRPAPGQH